MTRSEKQAEIQAKYEQFRGKGFLSAPTGFGKTRVGVNAVKRLLAKNPNRIVHVVAPRTKLVDQWKKEFGNMLNLYNISVFTINKYTMMDNTERVCDMVIGDEGHWVTSDTAPVFSKVITDSSFRFCLFLSASFSPEQKRFMRDREIPEIDHIPLAHARKMGWVASYKEFNIGIDLPEEDKRAYDLISSEISKGMAVFDYNLELVRKCMGSIKPLRNRITGQFFDPICVQVARDNGWNGNSAAQVYGRMDRMNLEQAWGNPDHNYAPKKITTRAFFLSNLIRERRAFINNYEPKLDVAKEIFEKFPESKIITFGESIALADKLAEMIGDEAVVYHSKVKSIEVEERKQEIRKTYSGAKKLAQKMNTKLITRSDLGYIVEYKVKRKIGASKAKEYVLKRIQDNRFKARLLSTAKALDEGLDIPDLDVAIIHSRTQNSRVNIQRSGRVARLFTYKDGTDKVPYVFNIYIRGTKDEDWLKSSQKESVGVTEIDTIDEVFEENFHMMN
jgi:superfamily II DNA or RNA helicase